MKPVVDCRPSKMNPYQLVPFSKMRDTFFVACQIDKENKVIMNKLNYIHRNGVSIFFYTYVLKKNTYIFYLSLSTNRFCLIFQGVVDTFNPNAFKINSIHWKLHMHYMKSIVKTNKQIYELIMNAVSSKFKIFR